MTIDKITTDSETIIQRSSQKIAYISAVLVTIWAALYFIGLAGKLVVDGSVHSTSSPSIQWVSAVVGILLDISLLVLFISLRRLVPIRNQVYADLATLLMSLVCVTSSMNWFVQLTIVPGLVQMGDASMLALLDVHHTGSVMFAFEHLGWGLFFGLSAIFMAASFAGTKLGLWIRWLLTVSGILSLIHFIGIISGSEFLSDTGYIAWGILLPAASILLIGWSKQQKES